MIGNELRELRDQISDLEQRLVRLSKLPCCGCVGPGRVEVLERRLAAIEKLAQPQFTMYFAEPCSYGGFNALFTKCKSPPHPNPVIRPQRSEQPPPEGSQWQRPEHLPPEDYGRIYTAVTSPKGTVFPVEKVREALEYVKPRVNDAKIPLPDTPEKVKTESCYQILFDFVEAHL